MRPDGKHEGLRQSMGWVHTWSGLVLGWLLYAIFLTGTLSFFLDEINQWMRPELHRSVPGPATARLAVESIEKLAPDATTWTLNLHGPRNAEVQAFWRPPGAESGRAGMKHAYLDAATGETIDPRETRAGNFLYRFHFELYGLPRDVARWIVGFATMFMFVAIISGVIMHRKIFVDYFTFRRNRGPRTWMDAHNATSVYALPFHLVITFSGLLLLMGTIMPAPREALYPQEDTRLFTAELRGMNPLAQQSTQERAQAGRENGGRDGREARAPRPVQADVDALIAQAQSRWDGASVGSIVMTRQDNFPVLELREEHGISLANRGMPRRLRYDGVTGHELETVAMPAPSAVRASYNTMVSLHLGRFADPVVRWALFLSGVLGTLMIATGMMLWVSKRLPARAKTGRTHFGHRLVEVTNIAAIAGLTVATAVYFFLNRLLPVGIEGRSDWEINGFFIVWALTLAHALLRPDRRAWQEQLGSAAALFAAIPLLNALTGGEGLIASIPAGKWPVAGFDLVALVCGLLLAWAAVRMGNEPRTSARPAPRTVSEVTVNGAAS